MNEPIESPPAELKSLVPFIKRANELQNADKVISYWCCFYAAQLGISGGAKGKEAKTYLLKLMDSLETQKLSLSDNETITNDVVSSAYIENFALKVFVGADNEDRAGKASRATAQKFLVASNFLELLKNFGPLETEIQEKVKYAKWKAADIAKAFKQGRKPQPGPPGGDPKEEAAAIGDALAIGLQQDMQDNNEQQDLAKELAKLTSNPATVGSTGVPTAVSSTEPRLGALASDGDGRRRSISKARMSINLDGSNVSSPNFSKPLQHQLPRTGSISSESATESVSPIAPLHPTQSKETVWNYAVAPLVPPPTDDVDSEQGGGMNAGGDPGSQASFHSNGAATPPKPSQPTLQRSPTLLPGSRPLPVPPTIDGLPIPPVSAHHQISATSPLPSSLASGAGTPPSAPLWTSPTSHPISGASSAHVPASPAGSFGFPDSHSRGGNINQASAAHRSASPLTFHLPSAPSGLDQDKTSTSMRFLPSAPSLIASQPPQLPFDSPSKLLPSSNIAAPLSSVAAPPIPTSVPESLPAHLSTRIQKLARGAASAVDFDDLDTARLQLRQSLDILEGRVTK